MEVWQDPKSIITWLIIVLLIFLTLLFFIVSLIKISYNKSVEKKELLFNEKIKNEQKLKNAIITVQDQERKHIASELHDQVSNKLNLLILMLNNIKTENGNEVVIIKNEVRKIINKNRDISHYLFPVEIENIGLFFTLQDLSLKYKTPNFEIKLICDKPINFSCKQTEIQLYRVIQESLTNVLKHSKATVFTLHFKTYKNQIILIVSDNGIGFEKDVIKKGLGFTSIETRLHSINASFKFKSKPKKGTQLIIVI